MTQAEPEPRRCGTGKGFTIEQAREEMCKVGDELQANAGHLAEVLDAAEATQPEHTGEYYVMPHGFTASANRPVARFPYAGVEAGNAFDQALTWAREYVRTSFDVWHADAERSTRAGDGRRAAGLAPLLTRPGPGRGLDPSPGSDDEPLIWRRPEMNAPRAHPTTDLCYLANPAGDGPDRARAGDWAA